MKIIHTSSFNILSIRQYLNNQSQLIHMKCISSDRDDKCCQECWIHDHYRGKGVAGVRNEQTCFANSSISNGDTLYEPWCAHCRYKYTHTQKELINLRCIPEEPREPLYMKPIPMNILPSRFNEPSPAQKKRQKKLSKFQRTQRTWLIIGGVRRRMWMWMWMFCVNKTWGQWIGSTERKEKTK